MGVRRLRVLAEHPGLGRAGDILTDVVDGQSYVDAGLAEWVVTRAAGVETADATPVVEVAAEPSPRVRRRR